VTLSAAAPPHAREAIAAFLRAHAAAPGVRGLVVGLSGGIDSALVARLARDALGPGSVEGVLLPDETFPEPLAAETEGYARSLGIAHRRVAIGPVLAALRTVLPEVTDRTDLGNLAARVRMSVLYAIARGAGRLVAGTGNKSELLTGYFTKYGDGGVDLMPIGDLYKTGVRGLSEELGLPEAIRHRPPSAGLWPGQTDEAELGLPYERLDPILRGLEELRPLPEIAGILGEAPEIVAAVQRRVSAARHKRRPPPIPKLSLRTVGLDWRE
jgi:NAD+ synthase